MENALTSHRLSQCLVLLMVLIVLVQRPARLAHFERLHSSNHILSTLISVIQFLVNRQEEGKFQQSRRFSLGFIHRYHKSGTSLSLRLRVTKLQSEAKE